MPSHSTTSDRELTDPSLPGGVHGTVVAVVSGELFEGETAVSRGNLRRPGDVLPEVCVDLVGVGPRRESPLTGSESISTLVLAEVVPVAFDRRVDETGETAGPSSDPLVAVPLGGVVLRVVAQRLPGAVDGVVLAVVVGEENAGACRVYLRYSVGSVNT